MCTHAFTVYVNVQRQEQENSVHFKKTLLILNSSKFFCLHTIHLSVVWSVKPPSLSHPSSFLLFNRTAAWFRWSVESNFWTHPLKVREHNYSIMQTLPQKKKPTFTSTKTFKKGQTLSHMYLWRTDHTWSTEEHIMVHKRFGWQMRGGRKRCQSRLNFGTSLLWTASTSRGHAAVTGGKAPVNGGWHNIPRRVSGREGREGEGRGGEDGRGVGCARRCGVTVMSARVKCNHR